MATVAIVGGAVAGSEAAAVCAERGLRAVVFDQGPRPYGKIEDGLPRWHVKLRQQEYARIDANLDRPEIRFVPMTRIGVDLSLERLRASGFAAVILANGAWRDRPLPVAGAEAFAGRGLHYQNPLVRDFNHGVVPEEITRGEGGLVVGGGLASIDVVKLISLEAWSRALGARGVEADVVALEHRGIPSFCAAHGVDPSTLRLTPPRLVYRRDVEDMPLADAPADATEAQIAKARAARRKILERVVERYHVEVLVLRTPVGLVVGAEDEARLAGLVLRRTELVDGRVREREGSEEAVRAPFVVSSIGSVPEPIEGVPARGELYDFDDLEAGSLRELPGVYGLGNVLTGRGNVRDSRENARLVMERLLGGPHRDEGGALEAAADAAHGRARQAAEALLERLGGAMRSDERAVDALVEERWSAARYDGRYGAWLARHPPS